MTTSDSGVAGIGHGFHGSVDPGRRVERSDDEPDHGAGPASGLVEEGTDSASLQPPVQDAGIRFTWHDQALHREERLAGRAKAEPANPVAESTHQPSQATTQEIARRAVDLEGALRCVEVGKRGRAAMDARRALSLEARDLTRAAGEYRHRNAESLGERAHQEHVGPIDVVSAQRTAAAKAIGILGTRRMTEDAQRLRVVHDQTPSEFARAMQVVTQRCERSTTWAEAVADDERSTSRDRVRRQPTPEVGRVVV